MRHFGMHPDFAFGEMLKLEKTNKLVSKESILEQLRS